MRDILGTRSRPFGAEETAGRLIRIDMHQAAVLQHDAAAALVFETDLAADEGLGREVGEPLAHHRDLRVREHHGDRGPPHQRLDRGVRGRIFACRLALVGGFVQQGQDVVGVAGDENRRRAALQRGLSL